MKLFDLSGKVAVVTGGGRGLGRAMAVGLAEAGAHVIVAGRGQEEMNRVSEEVRAKGLLMDSASVDLSSSDGPAELVGKVVSSWGRVDIVLHAAGSQIRKPAEELNVADWDSITNIHLRAGFLLAQASMVHWRQTETAGKIIFVGSLTSHIGIRNLVPYVSAKSGLSGLTRALAVEGAERGICVNAIIPGYYHTALTDDLLADPAKRDWVMSRIPMKRLGEPGDLVGAAVFLSSAASNYVTGAEIRVDGGWLAA